ncbi:hypothetical protein EJV47_10120 [Hymenobacter gummosus]|uniref:DUF5683 domain-containing protein n=1 Tax=Hymenobacter gummosus TaxID=1776032 RepID=A0A431U325_9BACT|nr:DUF5683 domain-containing protein [Hymenobacter gummosus]RTQ49990.1 hypothetical protein EJV47_10120 [Hymenobacter gummosus]
MKRASLPLAVGLFCLLPATATVAQTVTAGPDSVKVEAGPAVPDTARMTERLLGWRMTRPRKAIILAGVLPGAGQVYNRKYWKLPLVYAALGGTIYGEYFYWTRYKEFKAGKDARVARANNETGPQTVDNGPNSGNLEIYPATAAGDAKQLNALNFYRLRRDTFFAYIGLAYGAQILDALVDANLYDFDVSDNLALKVEPYVLPLYGAPAAGVAFTFTLRPTPAVPRRH